MKTAIKKISTITLTLTILLMAYMPAALGAPAGNGMLTVSSTGSSVQSFDGRTINAYKLFDVTSVNLDSVTYEVNPAYITLLTGAAGIDPTGKSNAEINHDLVNWLETKLPGNSADIKATAQALQNDIAAGTYTPEATKTGGTDATSVSFDSLDWGYYLLLDGNDLTGTAQMANTFPILTTFSTANETINIKSDIPTIEKTIDGANKGTSAEIGNTVNYTIAGKVPNTDGFNTYTYTIVDTLSEGLTYNNDMNVKIGVDTTMSNVNIAVINEAGGTTKVTAEITLLNAGAPIYTPGDAIEATYTASINEKAVVGKTGNTNNAQLTYSNNPGNETETDIYEIPDQPKVYPFGLNINKIDPGSTPLDGAVFTLSGNGVNTYYDVWSSNTGTNGSFIFNGLKTGTLYTLTENAAPNGYKPLTAPIRFELEATYKTDGAVDTLKAINVTGGYVLTENALDSGYLDLSVVNTAGSKLPNTGGMGTIIFTIVGIALIGGAVVLLMLSRKNKGNTK